MSGWVSTRLGELTELQSGFAFKSSQWTDDGVPVVKIGNVKDGFLDLSGCSYVSSEDADKSGSLLCNGDILIGLTGYVGSVCRIQHSCKLVLNQRVGVFRPRVDAVNSNFLYFVARSVSFKQRVVGMAYGSAQPNVAPKQILNIEINLPPIKEQRQIASILGALDEKIENNRKTAATLEEMARALYRSWFVDFDPVHAKAAGEKPAFMDEETAALFPDRFGDDGLPDGWEQTKVGQLCTIRGGKQLSKDEFSEAGQYPVFGGAGRMGAADRYNAEGFIVTVGRVGAYCGNFYHTIGKAWVNNNASIIVPGENLPPEFLYLALKYLDLSSIKKGAAQPFISNGDLAELEIVSPPAKLVRKAGQMFRYFFECLNEYERENKTLATLRETLLPKLMSGEIRVGEAREQVEEVT